MVVPFLPPKPIPEPQNNKCRQNWRNVYLKWTSGFADAEGGVLVIGPNVLPEALLNAVVQRNCPEIPDRIKSRVPEKRQRTNAQRETFNAQL